MATEAHARIEPKDLDELKSSCEVRALVEPQLYRLEGLGCALQELVGTIAAGERHRSMNSLAMLVLGELVEETVQDLAKRLNEVGEYLRSRGVGDLLCGEAPPTGARPALRLAVRADQAGDRQ
jgi:hypothetical protein